MAINFPDNIKVNVGNPLDSRYLNSSNQPYISTGATIAAIPLSQRYVGLTVNINNVEYWWGNDVTDGGLVEKLFTGGGTITGATNGLSVADKDIALGGELTTGTTINGGGLHDLSITNISGFQVSTSGETSQILLEPAGMTLSYSGVSGTSSVSLESIAGLTYDGNYRNDFTEYSLPDAGYVTGLTSSILNVISGYTGVTAPNTFLKLDQTIPQDVCNGQPYFHEGLILHEYPTPALITGHTVGRMFYDPLYETITAQIGHPDTCGNAVNLQLGQEMHRLVWNETGVEIPNGAVVRTVTTHCGSGICADTPAVCLAKADTMVCANVIGVATQVISASTYGFITTVGYVSDIDTTSGAYSGFTAGDTIYLSPTVEGGVTNVPPVSPNVQYKLGRLTTTGTTGKLNVDLNLVYRLDDLADVNAPTPGLDDVLKWNGLDWVNGTVGSSSASAGINFYYATPVINSRTSPAGISQDGTSGFGIQVATLAKIPVTTGGTIILAGLSASDNRAFAAWGRNASIQRTVIDAGLWEFYDYVSVDTVVGTTYLIHGMYQVVDVTGSTITTTGATANSRTATITSNQFTGDYFNPDAINTNASYLQTPSGIYQITASASTNSVTITVPTGYVNESGVSGSTWNRLFTGSTESIENATPLYQTKIIAPAFNISPTDKLGQISFVSASGAYTLSLSYNGTSAASFFISPLVTLHNDLSGLQGGSGNQRYHVYQSGATLLGDITATAAEINVLDGIPPTLTSTELGYVDGVTSSIQTQLNSKLATSIFTAYTGTTLTLINSKLATTTFTGYTASTQPIIDAAITGATNYGGGITIFTGTTGRNLDFNTLVGSGSTVIQKVGNEIVVYSTGGTGGDYVFTNDIIVSVASGKTFGRYVNGDTVPASGKTAVQVIQLALSEPLDPTVVLTPSPTNIQFGASAKTVTVNFSYTINSLGASVASVLLEWRRGGTGAWSALTTSTGATSYPHVVDDSVDRFNTAIINYRYTVTDTIGGTKAVTADVTPTAYAVPAMSIALNGTVTSPETQNSREKGNVDSSPSGSIGPVNSLVKITDWTLERRYNGGSYIILASGSSLSVTSVTIPSTPDTIIPSSATSIDYRITYTDEYTSSTGGAQSITFKYFSHWGYNTATSLSSAQIIALANKNFLASRAMTDTFTAASLEYTYYSYPASYGAITSIILNGVTPILGAFNELSQVAVTNSYGEALQYRVYRSSDPGAFNGDSVAFS